MGETNEGQADRLARIERKLDELLAFRDQVVTFATAGLVKKASVAVKAKVGRGTR